jgi:recombinational DNA repair protein (RecF pathway)
MAEGYEALVLRTEASGESFLKLHLLTIEHGVFLCLKRIPKKSRRTTAPDLFDQAIVELEQSKQGTLQFVKDYQLIKRRDAIGQSYQSLQDAASLSQLLVQNAAHMPESEALYGLVTQALDAFATGKASEVVLLKAIFRLLKDEGYPVRESWWPNLPTDLKAVAKTRLNAPTPDRLPDSEKDACRKIHQNLHAWMRQHTDLLVPA